MSYQGTHIIINLKNLKANLSYIKSKLDNETKVMSVVKAFGYGSEPVKISKFLEKNGVDYFAVAYVNEGIALRKSGIKLPVLVLHPQADDFDDIIEYNLEPNIYSFRILNAFIKRSKSHPFHLKFNTGLNRLGFSINDIDGLCKILKGQANIKYLLASFWVPSAISLNINHGETSRTECDQEEGRGDQEEDRHQSQAEEGARQSSRIIIIIVTIDPLQIRGSELDQADEEVES